MNISGMDSNLTTLININNVTNGQVIAGQELHHECNSDSGQKSCFVTRLNNRTNVASHLSKYRHNNFEITQGHITLFM